MQPGRQRQLKWTNISSIWLLIPSKHVIVLVVNSISGPSLCFAGEGGRGWRRWRRSSTMYTSLSLSLSLPGRGSTICYRGMRSRTTTAWCGGGGNPSSSARVPHRFHGYPRPTGHPRKMSQRRWTDEGGGAQKYCVSDSILHRPPQCIPRPWRLQFASSGNRHSARAPLSLPEERERERGRLYLALSQVQGKCRRAFSTENADAYWLLLALATCDFSSEQWGRLQRHFSAPRQNRERVFQTWNCVSYMCLSIWPINLSMRKGNCAGTDYNSLKTPELKKIDCSWHFLLLVWYAKLFSKNTY